MLPKSDQCSPQVLYLTGLVSQIVSKLILATSAFLFVELDGYSRKEQILTDNAVLGLASLLISGFLSFLQIPAETGAKCNSLQHII